MMRLCVALAVCSAPLFCQSFEVAEIKINKAGPGPTSAKLINGQARVVNAPMRLLIGAAFNVTPDAVSGGPGWLDSDRFDLAAKSTPDATEDQLRAMLKTLLMERVKLKAHVEEKMTSAYALTVAKGGHKMKESTPTNPTDQKCGPADGPPDQVHIKCAHLAMSDLAKTLRSMAPRYITMPVVDKTDLKGLWEFQLDWTPMGLSNDGTPVETLGGSMFEAVAKLGLKLERAKLPVPIVVVDSIERVPVEN